MRFLSEDHTAHGRAESTVIACASELGRSQRRQSLQQLVHRVIFWALISKHDNNRSELGRKQDPRVLPSSSAQSCQGQKFMIHHNLECMSHPDVTESQLKALESPRAWSASAPRRISYRKKLSIARCISPESRSRPNCPGSLNPMGGIA